MACTLRNYNEPSGSVNVTQILDQNFGSCLLKKDAAPWSEGEVTPVHVTKVCGEAGENRHSLLTSAQGWTSGRPALCPGHLYPNEEAPRIHWIGNCVGFRAYLDIFRGITNYHKCRK